MSVARTFRSSIGAKWLMALTGIALLLFVIAHMLGNLQVFAGRDKLNSYAEGLQHLGPLLWAARLGLLTIFVIHVVTAIRIANENKAARPVPYATLEPQVTSYAARTMVMSGFIVLAFVLYHLAHLTFGWTNPDHFKLQESVMAVGSVADARLGAQGAPFHSYMRHDVYGMVVAGYQVWWISGLYVVAQALLCLHISHGASSALQTLGVTHPAMKCVKDKLGPAIAIVIFLGNTSIPAAILLGLVK
jgi:succinate dehydrogenase / fumarate reductase cytochrome b subunit